MIWIGTTSFRLSVCPCVQFVGKDHLLLLASWQSGQCWREDLLCMSSDAHSLSCSMLSTGSFFKLTSCQPPYFVFLGVAPWRVALASCQSDFCSCFTCQANFCFSVTITAENQGIRRNLISILAVSASISNKYGLFFIILSTNWLPSCCK